MFAAAAPVVGAGGGAGDGGAGDGGDLSGGDSGGDAGAAGGDESLDESAAGSGDAAGADEGEDLSLDEGDGADPEAAQRAQQDKDKDTADFKGLVSKRLVALKKEAPELAQVFQKYPKVQEQIEASFRRDMAYRELFPTVAEARQMREQFPGGLQDVEQLLTDVGEVEQLDKDFYSRDAQGNYAGHSKIIQNMFTDDREAAVSLFRTVPKEWARLDPESYNEVMGSIVGATFARAELPQWLNECIQGIDNAANIPMIKRELQKMLGWAQGFQKRKAEPSEEERRLQGQREQLNRESNERKQQDFTRFKQTFFTESEKLQRSIVQRHPSIAEMMKSKTLTDTKKKEIVGKIQTRIREHFKNSRAFMSKLRPAYNASNLEECLNIQKAQWSYPWVLNKFVRQVMAEETPNLVRSTPGARRAAAGAGQRPPASRGNADPGNKGSRSQQRTAPYKENGVWFSKEGRRLTTAEILRGAHLQS